MFQKLRHADTCNQVKRCTKYSRPNQSQRKLTVALTGHFWPPKSENKTNKYVGSVSSINILRAVASLIVGSRVRPHPFYFTPTLFIKAPLILKIPDPHPFSNLYVSYIHFWCHGNVVDWHPIALVIYHLTYFQPEDIPIFFNFVL